MELMVDGCGVDDMVSSLFLCTALYTSAEILFCVYFSSVWQEVEPNVSVLSQIRRSDYDLFRGVWFEDQGIDLRFPSVTCTLD